MKRRFWLRQSPPHSDDCVPIKPLLSLFSDGMASPGEARRVEHHLADCEDCRRALDWMRVTHRVIAERPSTLPPPDLRARIARAIAESDPAPLSVRTVRRSFVLRPALLAAAASLLLAGVVAEYPPLALRDAAVNPIKTVASVPHAADPTVLRHSPVAPATRRQVAVAPPHRPAPPVGASLPEPRPAVETRVAQAPDVPAHAPLVTAIPAVRNAPPLKRARPPVRPSLVAAQPKASPHGLAAKPPVASKNTMEATALPREPLSRKGDDMAMTTPEPAPPPASVEVLPTRPTQVAVMVPSSTPPHEDVLSNVRARLATFRAGAGDRKLYRDGSAHVQAPAFNDSGSLAPMYPVVYTPGLNDKP